MDTLDYLARIVFAFIVGVGSIAAPIGILAWIVHRITGDDDAVIATLIISLMIAGAYFAS